jgi:excisionase family DNA binding protein
VLNVSHRYLLDLLKEGEIPFRDEGTCLLIQREKLLEYKRRQRAVAEEAMQKLTDLSQELGLGY